MLSKTAEYALRAVVCLGAADEATSADTLASTTKIPRRYLHRVLQDLFAAGMVESRSGPGGGYSLAIPAKRLSMLEVINAVSPLERITTCPLGIPSHHKLCPLHAELDQAFAGIEAAFARVTIAALIRSTSGIIPLCG